MRNDTLGDRIKSYEMVSSPTLTQNSCVFLRLDGRAFHTFTKGCEKPFDQGIMDAMVTAASRTAKEMAGFKIAYTQSDEVTFLLTDFDELETQPWFGNKLNKLVSISASIFTAHFNSVYQHPKGLLATFDSRAFVVPRMDAPNVFVWRQMDWHRNSLLMLAQSEFSHKELQGKKAADLHDMLHGIGVNWAKDLSQQEKNGTFIYRDKREKVGQYFCYQTLKYQDIDELITEIIYDEYR